MSVMDALQLAARAAASSSSSNSKIGGHGGLVLRPEKMHAIWNAIGEYVSANLAKRRGTTIPGLGRVVPRPNDTGATFVLLPVFSQTTGAREAQPPPPEAGAAENVCLTTLSQKYGQGKFSRTDAQRGIKVLTDALANAVREGRSVNLTLGAAGRLESGPDRRISLVSSAPSSYARRATSSRGRTPTHSAPSAPPELAPQLAVTGEAASRAPSVKGEVYGLVSGMPVSQQALDRRKVSELAVSKAASTYLADQERRDQAEEERQLKHIEERRRAVEAQARQAEAHARELRRARHMDMKRHMEGTRAPRRAPPETWDDVVNVVPAITAGEAEEFWAKEARERSKATAIEQRQQATMRSAAAASTYEQKLRAEREQLDDLSREMHEVAVSEALFRREEQKRMRDTWEAQLHEKRVGVL